ncbi:MAG: lamin tail domain-containing protein [Candidatus Stygibacter frigidus]|nr:lamin tail domain-containing protein [Candidatus Stygibacter frigidus]
MKKLLILLLGLVFMIVSCSLDDTTDNNDPVELPDAFNYLVINEFLSHNDTAWPGPNDDYPDWIELYNGSDETIDVGGMYVSDDLSNLELSMIGDDAPELTTMTPGSYLVLIADGNPELGTLHLDLKLSDEEDFALVYSDGSTIVDQQNSGNLPDDISLGRVPDGTDNWEELDPSTPGTSNSEVPDVTKLVINEFLASNDFGAVDENGDHEDWIEIYNAGTTTVDLGGMYVTDDLTNLMTSMIPTNDPSITTIAPGEYLLLWADKEPEQGILHLDDVKLSGGGEQIGLTDIDGVTILDSLTYGEQITDVSVGRMTDGSETWASFGAGYDTMPTPGEANGSGNSAETIILINEFMSHNDVAWPGPDNEYPDWIELYNASAFPVDVGGMYVTDDLDNLELSMIGDDAPELTTMAPGSYLVLVANKTPELGALQVDLKLGDNEDFALVSSDGSTIVDQHNTEVVPDDQSMGRIPDGSDNWQLLYPSTPGEPNE